MANLKNQTVWRKNFNFLQGICDLDQTKYTQVFWESLRRSIDICLNCYNSKRPTPLKTGETRATFKSLGEISFSKDLGTITRTGITCKKIPL